MLLKGRDFVLNSGHTELVLAELSSKRLHLLKLWLDRIEMVKFFRLSRHFRDSLGQALELSTELHVTIEVALDLLLEFLGLNLDLFKLLLVAL